ncbi:MAG: thrombospondin type 3 repeat-containing protein [Candidatus Binatia bacterium]
MRDCLSVLARPLILGATLSMLLFAPAGALALDGDCDGAGDAVDNCPAKFNPTQADIDGDLAGDRCDADKDGDFLDNDADNCPKDVNGGQEDTDQDAVGDACDQCAEDGAGGPVDRHGCTVTQHCPCDGPEIDQSWRSQADYLRCIKRKARKFRLHGLITPDERRALVVAAREGSCGRVSPQSGDNDGDAVADDVDNCRADSNPSQRNTDGDGFGDACDSDKDNDAVLNGADNCPLVANADGQDDDGDGDSVGDACDACSGTGNDPVDRQGCSIDQACPCELDENGNPWASHSKYVRCVADEAFRFRLHDFITAEQADEAKLAARNSTCGERPPLCE